jgi:phage pi2 protein 07
MELLAINTHLRLYTLAEYYNSWEPHQQKLYRLFEENRDLFKKKSNGKNWLIMAQEELPILNKKLEFGDDIVFYTFSKNGNTMFTKLEEAEDVTGVLTLPLFNERL